MPEECDLLCAELSQYTVIATKTIFLVFNYNPGILKIDYINF